MDPQSDHTTRWNHQQPMSQHPSFPPGSGPNDPTEQHAHFPPGHAYRRSHSNSPFRHTSHPSPYPIPAAHPPPPPPSAPSAPPAPAPASPHDLKQEPFYAPTAAELYSQAIASSSAPLADPQGHFANGVTRLPPILQVEKKQVTTSATQAASASRRRNEAHFICPVPGCGSTFTRRFNLRGKCDCEYPSVGPSFHHIPRFPFHSSCLVAHLHISI